MNLETVELPNLRFGMTDEGYHLINFFYSHGYSVAKLAQRTKSSSKTIRKWLKRSAPPSCKVKVKRRLLKRADAIKARRRLVQRLLTTKEKLVRSRFTPKKRVEVQRVTWKRPYNSPRKICRALRTMYSIKVAANTVRNDLLALGRRARRKRKGPPLTAEQKAKRVRFCQAMLEDQARNILFSDECYINTNESGSGWQWVSKGEVPDTKTTESYPTQVLIWGCVGVGFRHLIILKDLTGAVDRDKYQKLILTPSLSVLRQHQAATGAVLQQDNARGHCGSPQWLSRRRVKCMDYEWPAKSCDLSPIETVWSWLKDDVSECAPFGIEELVSFIRQRWEAIPQHSTDKVVQSFGQRCKDCVKAQGEIIKPQKTARRK